ncbi:MAG: hypothetical protein J0H17_10405 [Rhizobiales bacterium]|nr:hypothetical protein [Hyphomicrobiales bacterium]
MLQRQQGRHVKAAACLIAVLSVMALPPESGAAVRSRLVSGQQQNLSVRAAGDKSTLDDVIALVHRRGWPAKLGRVCAVFEPSSSSTNCRFHQIALDAGVGTLDKHSFNVPLTTAESLPYVLMFRLRPLLGEFFVVSPRGQLLATFYRSRGADYTKIPNDEAAQAFEAELSYWQSNFLRIEQDLDNSAKRTTPSPELKP